MNTDSFIFECTIEKFSKKELGAGPGRLLLLGNKYNKAFKRSYDHVSWALTKDP